MYIHDIDMKHIVIWLTRVTNPYTIVMVQIVKICWNKNLNLTRSFKGRNLDVGGARECVDRSKYIKSPYAVLRNE